MILLILKTRSTDLIQPHSGNAQGHVCNASNLDITLPDAFHAAAESAHACLVVTCGANDLDDYSRADALRCRDYLIAPLFEKSAIAAGVSS